MIYPVIGAFEEEKEAYTLVTKLCWLLPAILVLATLTDLVLVFLYEKIGHPWREILAQETQVRVRRAERDLRQVLLQETVNVNRLEEEDREEEIAEGEDIPMVEMEGGNHEVEDDVVAESDVEMRFNCDSQSQLRDQTQGVTE